MLAKMNQKNLKEINLGIFDSIKNNIIIPNYDEKYLLNFNQASEILTSDLFLLFHGKLKNIHEFLTNVDQSHGELPSFLNNQFDDDFLKKLIEVNGVYNFCVSNNYEIKKDIGVFEKMLCKFVSESFLNSVGNPERTKIHTRFLPENKKWLARKTKIKQSISKKTIQEIAFVDSYGLNMFYHNSNLYKSLLEILEEKKVMLLNMGCDNLSKEIESITTSVQDIIKSEKFGFQRITISKLIKFLAKNFQFSSAYIQPIYSLKDLENTDAYDIINFCENVNINKKDCSIFDHYAKIILDGANISVLIGEIDAKSYFISYICEA